MTSKVISFQAFQAVEGDTKIFHSFVVALCEDGSLWRRMLNRDSKGDWERLTPALPEQSTIDNGFHPQVGKVI